MKIFTSSLLLVVLLISCCDDDCKVKNAIDDTYYMSSRMTIGELNKSTALYIDFEVTDQMDDWESKIPGNKYHVARLIFILENTRIPQRMFYLINMDEQKVVTKSGDKDLFFIPFKKLVYGESEFDLEGDRIMEGLAGN